MNETNPNVRTARTDPSAAPGPTAMKKTDGTRMETKEKTMKDRETAKERKKTEPATRRKLTNRSPKVLLSAEAERQLRVWTQAAKGEFSCFGVTEVDTDSGAIVVKKFFLPEQTCTDSHTSPDRESMGALMTELVRAGYDVNDLRCWAHSHADMNCFWSSEDADTIEQMDNGDWLVSIVTNKAGHFRARLDLYAPWRITVDKINVGFLASMERDETLEKELHEKVRARSSPWGSMWIDEDRRGEQPFGFGSDPDHGPMDRRFCERTSHAPPDDDIFTELQLVGLNPDQAAELLDALEEWQGDPDELWIVLDGVLGGDDRRVDPWSVLQALGEWGLVDGTDHAFD